MQGKERIVCALDVDNAYRAIQLAGQLKEHVGVFKIGLELVNSAGIGIFEKLRDAGAERMFYDAKLHDIPNTVAGAMRGIARLGAWSVTVHASGGSAMLRAAVEAARQQAEAEGVEPPKILGVTVLTSIGEEMLRQELRVEASLTEQVVHLAQLARDAGCDGIIASPRELPVLRARFSPEELLIITPGVRPAGADTGDQARVMTPAEAIRLGADYLVIGRPIIAASDPAAAAQRIAAEIASVRA